MVTDPFAGVLSPVVTPFDADLQPDPRRFVTLCQGLLREGASGLAVFGTNSEANSMAASERMKLLDALIEAGVPGAKLMPGTGACSITEAIQTTKHAVEHGCGGVLMLPPFYYKVATDDGLFDFFAKVIDSVADARLRLYLYHIPPVAQVPISYDLIERLVTAYPGTVVGIKDSSGDWSNTRGMLERFDDFAVFPGSEVFLLDGLRHGAVGCISATANVNMPGIVEIYDNWQTDRADELQARATAARRILEGYPMIPALKAVIANRLGDPAWATTRPPLRTLPKAKAQSLVEELEKAGYHGMIEKGALAA